jgi:hypothetical protein
VKLKKQRGNIQTRNLKKNKKGEYLKKIDRQKFKFNKTN